MDILQTNKREELLPGWLSIDFINTKLQLLYVVTMPFISAFAFTGTISIPLILSVFLMILMTGSLFNSGKFPEGFIGLDIVIILLLILLAIFSFIVNGWGNSKALNHTIAYLSTFLLFHVAIKFSLFVARDRKKTFRKVLTWLSYITVISACFANLEFLLSNVFRININDYIPRPSEAEAMYDATVLGLFYRARGFAPESGHFAFMMELFSPITIYYLYFSTFCRWRSSLKVAAFILMILTIIFTVSTASFVIVPVVFLIASIVYGDIVFSFVKNNFSKVFVAFVLISAALLILNYFFSFDKFILFSITDKLDSVSFEDRQSRIDFFYDSFLRLDIIKQFTGVGPAGFDILGFDEISILSLYHNVTFELGLFGLVLLLSLFLYVLTSILRLRNSLGFFLLMSFLSGLIHYYIIANFWYPWFWFITAFALFGHHVFFYDKHARKGATVIPGFKTYY